MTKKMMKDVANLTKDELVSKIRDAEERFFQARMQKATGQLKDTSSKWRVRKELARLKTMLGQKNSKAAASAR